MMAQRIIEINKGRITSGASLVERVGIALFALAATLTNDFSRPGFSKFAALIRKLLPSDAVIAARIDDESRFLFPYGDAYWSVLCRAAARYEPEIGALLETVRGQGALFIDCGANFGYWSVIASSPAVGAQVVGIEASKATHDGLALNAEVNASRFQALHRAVGDVSGLQLIVDGAAKHEQRSVLHDGPVRLPEPVETLALDDLPEAASLGNRPVIIKLDVEGVEIQTLKGASRLLAGDCIIAYEDHGSDRNHTVSRALRDDFGMRLFSWSAQRGFEPVDDLQTLDALKPTHRVGYDFFATASDNWVNRLLGPAKKTH